MELALIDREIPVWLEETLPPRRTTLSAESVVPDTQEDVGRVLSVRGSLLLKGKELLPHGVTVSGEARASVLYVTEDGNSLATLRLNRSFELEFAAEDPDGEALPQISWNLRAVEARILNPRKLAVSFEITASMTVFRRGSLPTGSDLPQGEFPGLHLLRSERDCLAVTGVTEKSFSLREQFRFPAGKPIPARIDGEELRFRDLGCEQVGERSIIKGELELTAFGLSEEGLPVENRFTLPFSQLLETGDAAQDQTRLVIEPSSVFLDWTETLDGERALDAEIHAVAQLCVRSRETLQWVDDAYSSRMPCQCQLETRTLLSTQDREKTLLNAQTRVDMLPEDCADLLAVQPVLGAVEQGDGQLVLPASLELLYRGRDGSFQSARRSLTLNGVMMPEGAEACNLALTQQEIRPQGSEMEARLQAELSWSRSVTMTRERVTALELVEESAWTPESLPSVYLVRTAGESLWDLAKEYHSSAEAISACNEVPGALLLIPTER